MKTLRRIAAPQVAGMRQSVEVQHAKKGVGRMLRRGLHGAKNWVLETDPDGTHRSVGTKLFRAAVVLLPVWIVLSATTGGPARGGHQTSFMQAMFSAIVVMLIGLGIFSARERRAGREEPWNEQAFTTEREDFAPETLVDLSSEVPTEALASSQVSESGFSGEAVTPSYNTGISDQSSHMGSEAVTQVVPHPSFEGASTPSFSQVSLEKEGGKEALAEVATSPSPGDALDGDNPTVSLLPGKSGGHPVSSTPESASNVQVTGGDRVETEAPEDAVPVEFQGGLTASRGAAEPPVSVWPVNSTASSPVQDGLFPQAASPGEVVTAVVSGASTALMAEPGPYPVTKEPVSSDWWLTKPDVEQPQPDPEPEPMTQEAGVDTFDPFATPAKEAAPQPLDMLGHDPAVLLFLAMRSMPEASEADQAAARGQAIEWVRREIGANRQSQRTAGRILGVSKTTIGNWLGQGLEADDGED